MRNWQEAIAVKKPWYTNQIVPMAALITGIVLLLGVLLSFRFVLAIAAIGLIGWGIWRCRS